MKHVTDSKLGDESFEQPELRGATDKIGDIAIKVRIRASKVETSAASFFLPSNGNLSDPGGAKPGTDAGTTPPSFFFFSNRPVTVRVD